MTKSYGEVFWILVVAGAITLVGNLVGFKINPADALVGMLLIIAIVMVGYTLQQLLRRIGVQLPSIAYISLVGILITYPAFPGSDWFFATIGKVQFLALTTPVLAYAGIAIGRDLDAFARLGWKIIVVALLVFTGTFIGSAVIAELLLRMTGQV